MFILPGAMKERNEIIAKGLVGSVALGVGQFCTNPGVVVTSKSEDTARFLQHIKFYNAEIPAGTMLSDRIKSNFSAGVQNLLECDGVKLISSGEISAHGNLTGTAVFSADTKTFRKNPSLSEEVFGPSTLHVSADDKEDMLQVARELEGHLTASIHGTEEDLKEYQELVKILEQKVGRLIFNGFPTGVEVCHSMVHGGPYPATTAPQSTSVGTAAIKRFARPVCYQDFPQAALPDQLKDENPLKIWRMINGEMGK